MRLVRNSLACAIILSLISAVPQAQAEAEASGAPEARIHGGLIAGLREGDVNAYLGIPYAAPPVGERRWRPPEAAESWKGVRIAAKPGASCYQASPAPAFGPWTHEYLIDNSVSEDCLYLNVWSKASQPRRSLPVLVWIHGGAFTSGSGAVPVYNGRRLAGRDVIVVTINYRLGIFGFFAHPDLASEAGTGPVGNFGLQDQIAALKWVRDNIAAFGGDPSRVTIAGQSAGAASVHALIISPLAKGLFRSAILESGMLGVMPLGDRSSAERTGTAYAEARGAPTLEALRAIPAQDLGRFPPGSKPVVAAFGPVIDGRLLPDTADRSTLPDAASPVPVIVGENADEGSVSPAYGVGTTSRYEAALAGFGSLSARARALYPASTDAGRAQAVQAMARDRLLAAIARQWGGGRRDGVPAYVYLFSHIEPGADAARYKAFHSSEIPYVFGTLDAATERASSDTDRQVSHAISTYWLNFIRRGDPNSPGLPLWPALTPGAPRLLRFGDRPEVLPLLSPEKAELMRSYLDHGGAARLF